MPPETTTGDRHVELGPPLEVEPADDGPDVDAPGPDVEAAPEPSSAADEPVPDVVVVPDPEVDDPPETVVGVAAVVPGICLDTTSPTTPTRAAAESATDVEALRTRLRASSRRRRPRATAPGEGE